MRKAKLSGLYYHSIAMNLDKQIEEAFTGKKGPGELPVKFSGKQEDIIKGIIVPMQQYDLSGYCAAWAYKALAESEIPDVVIIVGQSKSDSGITLESWETPYGIVRVDQALARALISKGTVSENNELFDEDEQIESQLPLLQFIFKGNLENLKILPLLVSQDVQMKKLAVDIKESLLELGKKAVVIVPTNFTKYGSAHNYIPFSQDANKKVYELDKGAIDLISEDKPVEFLQYVDEHAMNIENFLGITFALLLMKPKKVLLEQYYTTADLTDDHKNFISFAGIVLK
ncbi:MAG: AmmeMemoRadiSam system protein B [Candidatus Woesearchaeota archaeon]|jgi:AmmeMemoRadiSam system protein B